ncbi:hypothetical protein TNCV_2087891 [Trichonephila clavipes]|nr:hypothetical protein TNCV_2087891 [Trichonephila clavipes]
MPRCRTPRHIIKEAFGASLVYSSPCGLHILPKLSGVAVGRVSRASRNASIDQSFLTGDRSGENPHEKKTITVLQITNLFSPYIAPVEDATFTLRYNANDLYI